MSRNYVLRKCNIPTSHVVTYLDSLMRGIRRSFTNCQASDMDRLFCFSLLLTYLPVTESMKKTDDSCLSQPNKVIWKTTEQNVVLHCSASHCSGEGWKFEWFTFKELSHHRVNLDNKYSLDEASLHIKSLNTNDSGIYYCAAAGSGGPSPGRQHVGMGTTLVVKEQYKMTLKHSLLWVSFVLLAIYSLAIVTLIVKKYGCNTSDCRRMLKTDKNNSIKGAHFRDVLQEMHNRRNLGRGKKTASRNRSQAEAASADFNSSADDIYQNV